MTTPYSWADFVSDMDEDLWQLYWGLTKTVESEGLPILDKISYSEFVRFVIKNTDKPTPPPPPEEEIESEDDEGAEEEKSDEDSDDDEY